MKIYHIARRFNQDKWGGTESVIWNLASQFEMQDHSSPVLATSMFSNPGEEDLEGVTVKRFQYQLPYLGLSTEEKKQLELKGGSPLSLDMYRYLRKSCDADIIHAHVAQRIGGIARTAAKKMNIPYLVSLHGGHFTLTANEVEIMRKPAKNKLEWGKAFGFLLGSRKVLSEADAIVCVGKSEYDKIKEKFPNKRVIYQPNGVDAEKFRNVYDSGAFKKDAGYKQDEKMIVCISRLDPQKNQLLLLNTFAEYLKLNPLSRLCLVGSASNIEYYEQLEKRRSELGVEDKVSIITGYDFRDKRLVEAFSSADAFILPSLHEPFGIVILEAWAAGVPVIASAVGGISGFTEDNKNILHFKSDSQKSLLDCMNRLSDKELQNRLVENAAEEVKKYDWKTIAGQQLDLYRTLIEEKKTV